MGTNSTEPRSWFRINGFKCLGENRYSKLSGETYTFTEYTLLFNNLQNNIYKNI